MLQSDSASNQILSFNYRSTSSCTLEGERGTMLSIIVLCESYSGRDNNRWLLSVHLIYQLGHICGAITRLFVRTQESDYDKLPVSKITLWLRKFRRGEARSVWAHIGKPLNELETRCWRGKVREWWISPR